MNLLMRAYSTDENYDANIGFVYVKVTPAVARLILKRAAAFRRLKKEDDGAQETYYWSHDALYLGHDKLDDKVAEEVRKEGHMHELELSFVEADGERTECDQMMVDSDSVGFTCIPKHTEIYISSERVSLDVIRQVLKKKAA